MRNDIEGNGFGSGQLDERDGRALAPGKSFAGVRVFLVPHNNGKPTASWVRGVVGGASLADGDTGTASWVREAVGSSCKVGEEFQRRSCCCLGSVVFPVGVVLRRRRMRGEKYFLCSQTLEDGGRACGGEEESWRCR